eukprot:360024-Chlamydomonas_euryale.AAC.3
MQLGAGMQNTAWRGCGKSRCARACLHVHPPRPGQAFQTLTPSAPWARFSLPPHLPHPGQVDAAVAAVSERGVPVGVMRRTNRHGYKAGAMVDGLESLRDCGYECVRNARGVWGSTTGCVGMSGWVDGLRLLRDSGYKCVCTCCNWAIGWVGGNRGGGLRR